MLGPAEIEIVGRFALDLGLGKLAEKALDPAAEAIWRAIKAVMLPLYDPAFASVRLNLQEHFECAAARDHDFAEKLQRSLERGEGAAILAQFIRAAAQATTDERMRMLAAAAAGMFTPDLDSDMRSRVARAVSQLEPADVVLLRDMRSRFRRDGAHQAPFATRLARSHGALQATGCIVFETQNLGDALVSARRRRADPELRTVAHVTDVGHAVLRALEEWEPEARQK